MTPVIREALLAVSDSPAGSMIWKATAVAALALAGWWTARRTRAAVRHAALAAAFAVLAVLPAASMLAPAARARGPAVSAGAVSGAVRRSPVAPAAVPAPGVSWSALLAAAWGAGAAIFLLPMAVGLWQVRRLRRSGVPWRGGEQVAGELAREAGVQRRVDVLLDEDVAGPMTCGVARPAIVLPRDAERWDAEELERALAHELEHARRCDWAMQCAARVVCAFYWFHPLVWMMGRRLMLEAEQACDDAVLRRSEATAYADQLVALAERLAAGSRPPLLAMASRSDLARRVDALLDTARPRGRAGWRAWAAICVAAAMALAITPLRIVAAAPQEITSQDSGGSAFMQVSAETWLVIEPVTVLDARGQAIEELNANDFKLTEDGREMTISIFEYQKMGGSIPSYYVLGYYTFHQNADHYRNISITCLDSRMAKLEYRTGYMDYAAINHGWRPATPAPVTVPEGVRPPVILRKVEAAYADEARKAKYQGTVMLRVVVDETGKAANVHVVRSLGLGLDEKAMEAVKQWRFRPAMQNGSAISMPIDVAFSFRLL